jgi:hypothetical protein
MSATSFSPQFLADLREVCGSARSGAKSWSPTFLAELDRVYNSLPLPTTGRLQELGERLSVWRKHVEGENKQAIERLPPDDPLRCPISLFGTMDYGRLETAHTNVLAWLLDPSKPHGFAETLLRALLNWHSDGCGSAELNSERVVKEHPIPGGRLDVLAEGNWMDAGTLIPWVLAIEAKIDAWEGENQLAKYDKWLDQYARGRRLLRIFLTVHGKAPEGGDKWKPLSFLELARVLRGPYPALKGTEGFEFLRLYLAGVMQDICGYKPLHAETAADPFSVAAYLKTVRESPTKGVTHGRAR